MESFITTVYVIADEVIRVLKIQDDQQSIMSNAEVITFAIVSAKSFMGNFKMTRYCCQKMNLFPKLLSNSRLNRRIHKISWTCWEAIFRRYIRSRTERGFLLKIYCFILSYSISFVWQGSLN